MSLDGKFVLSIFFLIRETKVNLFRNVFINKILWFNSTYAGRKAVETKGGDTALLYTPTGGVWLPRVVAT